jgi:hypothetical protein
MTGKNSIGFFRGFRWEIELENKPDLRPLMNEIVLYERIMLVVNSAIKIS